MGDNPHGPQSASRADRLLAWLTLGALLLGGAGTLAVVLWADALL